MSRLVKMLIDKDGYCVRAGDFSDLNKEERKELSQCVVEGGIVKEMTIEAYRSMDIKWIYEKPKPLPT